MKKFTIAGRTYDVNENDQIVKIRGGGVLKPRLNKDGYLEYSFNINGKTYLLRVHRFVWLIHKGPIPEGMTVDHKDDNKLNNHIENLQLLTRADNAAKGNSKKWDVLSPEGRLFTVTNLNALCKVYGLKSGAMSLVAQGKLKQHKGWRVNAA